MLKKWLEKEEGMAEIFKLYEKINPIPEHKRHALNDDKGFEYGYNKDWDIVVIGKDGTVGEIYDIQGLKVGLPSCNPDNTHYWDGGRENQYWRAFEYPPELKRIKTIFEWDKKPEAFKEKYTPFIEEEFNRRENGFWFANNGIPTYITGDHYMYLQWSKTDVGHPDFREANRVLYIFWEACVADPRSYGMMYGKIRRSGASNMGSEMLVNGGTSISDSKLGIISKDGGTAKAMFTDKVVPMAVNLPFFFKPIQDGMDKPKTEIAYRIPAKRFTHKRLQESSKEREDELDVEGLNTVIDWQTTSDNAYDSQKLYRVVLDEMGKLEKPNNLIRLWAIHKTCLRLGRRIVGKAWMCSTVNALDKGGDEFKTLYYDSKANKRNKNGQTASGLYALFIPMEYNTEGFIDKFGHPVLETPEKPVMGADGDLIDVGVIESWENEVEGLKNNPELLNEYYRQYPRTEEHMFRDDAKKALFNLIKIYDQVDFNGAIESSGLLTRGNFMWRNGVRDSTVEFHPSKNGRFLLSWTPSQSMQNRIMWKNGVKSPANEHIGAFGCDPYDISAAADEKRGSKGAMHGLTKFSMEKVPSNMFFLEYIARPQMAEIFFEDVLMACIFYGMPLLAENNKPRLLYHFKRRGYRGYSMNRPDKTWSQLSKVEKEIGGIPNSSQDIIQSHAAAIESFVEMHVGIKDNGEAHPMYYNRTLNQWASFDISKRTLYDAAISSGLAIMACNRMSYRPVTERQVKKIPITISKYNNKGFSSQIVT